MSEKPVALPLEDGDFYIESGQYVFTEKYHLKRGFCCQSGCRHCPYETREGGELCRLKSGQENEDD